MCTHRFCVYSMVVIRRKILRFYGMGCVKMQIKGGRQSRLICGNRRRSDRRWVGRKPSARLYINKLGLKEVEHTVNRNAFDLFEAVPYMMVSCSDGSASPHTSVTTNWTALPHNLQFECASSQPPCNLWHPVVRGVL